MVSLMYARARLHAAMAWRSRPMPDHAPILIVGAGPAGIAAACAAVESGVSVTIVDDNPNAGGQIWRGAMPALWQARLSRAAPRVLANARAIGFTSSKTLL